MWTICIRLAKKPNSYLPSFFRWLLIHVEVLWVDIDYSSKKNYCKIFAARKEFKTTKIRIGYEKSVAQLVEALCHYTRGSGFDSR